MKNFQLIISVCFLVIALNGCVSSSNQLKHNTFKATHNNYILETAASGDNWQVLRYLAKTGEAWVLYDNQWKKILDDKKLPESHYSIKLITTSTMNWQAIRLDVISGESWMIHELKWVDI